MSQNEVMKLLRKSKKKLFAKEIAKKLNKARSSINRNLKKLYEQGEVKRFEDRTYLDGKKYKIKSYSYKIK